MKTILIIAVGSGIGGALRYGMATAVSRWYPFSFPLGIFLVNILGCLLIGIFAGWAEKGALLSPEARIFLTTGLCGGFTTFSTFAYDNVLLLRSGEIFHFCCYAIGSVVVGILATFLGILVTRI